MSKSSLYFYPITSQHYFSNRKTHLCQWITQWWQQITVKEHLFGDFSLTHLTSGFYTYPTDTLNFTCHPLNGPEMCAVDDFQCLIFGNSQSPHKFTGNPKIVSHPTSSQKILKQQIKIYICIVHHLRVNGTGQYLTRQRKNFLDIYSCHMTYPTHIRPSFMMTYYSPNILQQNLSPFNY